MFLEFFTEKEFHRFMAAIDDLTAAITQLSTDVQALIAKQGTPNTEVEAAAQSIAALDATVKTALGS